MMDETDRIIFEQAVNSLRERGIGPASGIVESLASEMLHIRAQRKFDDYFARIKKLIPYD